MATLAELRADITRILQDSSYDNTEIDAHLNQCRQEIAAGPYITYPGGTRMQLSPLPDLMVAGSTTVTTDTSLAYVSLPTNFSRDLFKIVSSTEDTEVTLYPEFQDFMDAYPTLDLTGTKVTACARQGSHLYYQGIPSSAETLKLYYYKKPTDMSKISDTPDGLPSWSHIPVLTNAVTAKIFAEIYEGDDVQAAGSIKYRRGQYYNALVDLEEYISGARLSYVFGIK